MSEWGTYKKIFGNLEKADIVEIERGGYKHFAMYYGTSKKNGRALCFHVYQGEDGIGKKHLAYLDEVVGYSLCRINNLIEEATSRGLTERSKAEQINQAKEGLLRVDFVDCPYSILNNNCECYVTEWKYGVGFSQQVDEGKAEMLDYAIFCLNPLVGTLTSRASIVPRFWGNWFKRAQSLSARTSSVGGTKSVQLK